MSGVEGENSMIVTSNTLRSSEDEYSPSNTVSRRCILFYKRCDGTSLTLFAMCALILLNTSALAKILLIDRTPPEPPLPCDGEHSEGMEHDVCIDDYIVYKRRKAWIGRYPSVFSTRYTMMALQTYSEECGSALLTPLLVDNGVSFFKRMARRARNPQQNVELSISGKARRMRTKETAARVRHKFA